MIRKGIVLLRIQYLQQGCCRVSIIGGGKLIYLIQYHNRVGNSRLMDTVHNSSGHSPQIGSSMTSNIRLISNTAQTYPDIFSAKSLGNALSDTGLSRSGSTYKEKDGTGLLLL